MTTYTTKMLIIGSGPAGYTAAIYAARANISPILVTGDTPGGQLTITTEVENYPGFASPIQGPWLMEEMRKQAENVGATLHSDIISEVDFTKRPFVCKSANGNEYIAETVVISTGAQAKWLDIPSEKAFQGYGVSGCATCDGFFYKNKTVAVVGGGNTAVEEALYLTKHASKVYLIHRREELKSEKILQDRLFANEKIEFVTNSAISEIKGNIEPMKYVTGVDVINLKTNQISHIALDGVFIAIGHRPSTDLFKGKIDMDGYGYINTIPGSTKTSIPGVFAAGDVQDKHYRQAITAAGTGCMAALDVQRFLENN